MVYIDIAKPPSWHIWSILYCNHGDALVMLHRSTVRQPTHWGGPKSYPHTAPMHLEGIPGVSAGPPCPGRPLLSSDEVLTLVG